MGVHRLALATLVATLVLVVLGGLVTNTGSALAVPDWPTTFGHNMFLYPWSGMVGGVLYEHGHRLVGSLVGLLTVGLAAALWWQGRLRWLATVAVLAVVVQGVLGGLRVVLLKAPLAIVHGGLAQAFVALVAVIAFLTSPAGRSPVPVPPLSTRRLALVVAAIVYAQVVTGALLTHAGWLALHLAGAVVVFVLVPMVTARVRRGADPVARRLARIVVGLLVVQLLLGIGAFVGRFTTVALPLPQVTGLALPAAHRLVGALVLAASVVLAVRLSPGLFLPRPAHRAGALTAAPRVSP